MMGATLLYRVSKGDHQSSEILLVTGLPDVWRGDERAVKQLRHDAELEGNIEFADCESAISRLRMGLNIHRQWSFHTAGNKPSRNCLLVPHRS